MFHWILTSNVLVSLLTLIVLEVIFSIDNIVFLSVLIYKLPKYQHNSARFLGLIGGLLLRIIFLIFVVWIIHFTNSLFFLVNHFFSFYDLILFFGGVFLIWKSLMEIYSFVNSSYLKDEKCFPSFSSTVLQIMFLDIVFSLDSVVIAIGISNYLSVIIISIIFSFVVILIFSNIISEFINSNSFIKMLSLVFVFLIGFSLILESFCLYVSRLYVYFSIFISLIVEILNLLRIKKSTLKINNKY